MQGTARGARVLDGSATVDMPAKELAAGRVDDWKASARMKLEKMPLRTVGWLRDRQIRGSASGELAIDGLHDDARLRGTLSFSNLQLGDVPCKHASASVSFDGRTLDGDVRNRARRGFSRRRGTRRRGGAGARAVASARSVGPGPLVVKQFRAAVLMPFLGGAVTELDGRIDADARVEVDVGAKAVRPSGQITYRNGTFELATFGNQFHDATATIKATPDGIVRLEDAAAHGLSGTVQAAATARFDGLVFAGVRANVRMPAKDPLPLVIDGVQMGSVAGGFISTPNAPGAGGTWRYRCPRRASSCRPGRARSTCSRSGTSRG